MQQNINQSQVSVKQYETVRFDINVVFSMGHFSGTIDASLAVLAKQQCAVVDGQNNLMRTDFLVFYVTLLVVNYLTWV